MELSDIESFDFFFDSIWKKQQGGGGGENPGGGEGHRHGGGGPATTTDRVVGNIVDTIIFQQGVPYKWLFTSVKSGEILKKMETKLTAELIVKVFKSRCRLLKGCKPYHLKAYIATIWYYKHEVGSDEIMFSRLVDEEELSHILSHHLYADISAIQLYIGGWPLKGSGVFEHAVTLRPSGVGYTHETVEIGSLPVDQQELTLNTFNRSAQRLIIMEKHHETIKMYAAKFTKVIEQAAHAKVLNVIFEVNFNSSLTPLFICARNISLLSVPQNAMKIFTVRSGLNNDFDKNLTVKVDVDNHAHDSQPTYHTPSHDSGRAGQDSQIHHHLSVPSSPANIKGKLQVKEAHAANNAHDEMRKTLHIVESLDNGGHGPPAPSLRHGPSEKTFDKFAEYTISKHGGRPPRPATAGNSTFHRDKAHAEKREKLGAPKPRPTSASHHHLTATEATKLKSNYYLKLIKGDEEDEEFHADKLKARRPSSAPGPSKSSASDVSLGSHGVARGGRRSSGFESRLRTLTDTCPCMGEYCGFASPNSSSSDFSINEMGIRAETGVSTWTEFYKRIIGGEKSLECEASIAFKSILLAKAETKYIGASLSDLGFELWQIHQHTADIDQISAGFTRSQLTRVVNKCKDESHKIIFSAQKNEKHKVWDSTTLTYKKLVYSEALVHVHPSRFYYTVPVCKDCYKIYTLMDQQRETLLFKRPDVFAVSQDEKQTMRKKQKYLDAYTASRLKAKREEQAKKEIENWEAAMELEIKSDDDDVDEEEDDQFAFAGHHHHHQDSHPTNDGADDEEEEEEGEDQFQLSPSPMPQRPKQQQVAQNPELVDSLESDGPIEYNYHYHQQSKWKGEASGTHLSESQEALKNKFENRMDQKLTEKTGSVQTMRGRSSAIGSNMMNGKRASKPPKLMTNLKQMEATVQQNQPTYPKSPPKNISSRSSSNPPRQQSNQTVAFPVPISIANHQSSSRPLLKGVSKEELVYHKNAPGSMSTWARILVENQPVQSQISRLHKHVSYVAPKWSQHDGRSGGLLKPIDQPSRSSSDLRRSKSAGTSRSSSNRTSGGVGGGGAVESDKENNATQGKIRPKSAMEKVSNSNRINNSGNQATKRVLKPFVSGSRAVQMSPPKCNALERHQGTLNIYKQYTNTRPSSSGAVHNKGNNNNSNLLPLDHYSPGDISNEADKVAQRLESKGGKRAVFEQQKEWAEREREQQRLSPEKVYPTRGTADSWSGTVTRKISPLKERYGDEDAVSSSPFGPAPIFVLPSASTATSNNNMRSSTIKQKYDSSGSPEMKISRDKSGKVVVQVGKTSNLILPYETMKMQQYDIMTSQHANNTVSYISAGSDYSASQEL